MFLTEAGPKQIPKSIIGLLGLLVANETATSVHPASVFGTYTPVLTLGYPFVGGEHGAFLQMAMRYSPHRFLCENEADGHCFPHAFIGSCRSAVPKPVFLSEPNTDHSYFVRVLIAQQLFEACSALTSVVERFKEGQLPSSPFIIHETWKSENRHFYEIFKMISVCDSNSDTSASVKPDAKVFREAAYPLTFTSCKGRDFHAFMYVATNFFMKCYRPEDECAHASIAVHCIRLKAHVMKYEANRCASSSSCRVMNIFHWVGWEDVALCAKASKRSIYLVSREVSGGTQDELKPISIIKLPADLSDPWDFRSDNDLALASSGQSPIERKMKFWKFYDITQYKNAVRRIFQNEANVVIASANGHYVSLLPPRRV